VLRPRRKLHPPRPRWNDGGGVVGDCVIDVMLHRVSSIHNLCIVPALLNRPMEIRAKLPKWRIARFVVSMSSRVFVCVRSRMECRLLVSSWSKTLLSFLMLPQPLVCFCRYMRDQNRYSLVDNHSIMMADHSIPPPDNNSQAFQRHHASAEPARCALVVSC
jgi:hypothetical protein